MRKYQQTDVYIYQCVDGWLNNQGFSYECVTNIEFSYFSTKTYVVGTQKNCLNERIILSTLIIC